VFSPVTTHTENKRRVIVIKLGEMVEHERDARAATALAASTGRADPMCPDLLQCVAAEDAAAVAALLAAGPRLRGMLEAPSLVEGDVRAARCAADAGGSSHAYIFRERSGGEPNSRAAHSGQ
jgi:hypothetical protein